VAAPDPRSPSDPEPTVADDALPDPDAAAAPIIDWSRTARRLRAILLVIGSAIAVTWLVVGFVGDGPTVALLAELVGIGLLVAFAVEVVVVGSVAVRGMLAAGERGDRLAGDDVFLLPPQLLRGYRRGDRDPSER
jgi:hypothetical protein